MKALHRLCAAAAASGPRFMADQRGATALEYGLIVSGISLIICASVFAMGDGIKTTLYERLASALAGM